MKGLRSAVVVFVPLVMVVLGNPYYAQETTSSNAPGWERTPELKHAVEMGLAFLASRQHPRSGAIGSKEHVATTALACLAFLAYGDTPNRGKYAKVIKRGLDFIIKTQSRISGYINEGVARGSGGSGMHGHGFATLFLAEVWGMTHFGEWYDRKKVGDALRKAVRLIEKTQQRNGGWFYEPFHKDMEEGSVTVTQVAALRAARNAGIKVSIKKINKAVEYMRKSTRKDGVVNYRLAKPDPRIGITAAGMSVLNFLGQYKDKRIKKGLNYLIRTAPFMGGKGGDPNGWQVWYYYTSFYATIAMYQQGDEYWKKWWPRMCADMIKKQETNGSWRIKNDPWGGSYGNPVLWTAFALLTLEVSYKLLPIFQR
jgi:hypothetical protein